MDKIYGKDGGRTKGINLKIRAWLQIGRAQTWPADWLMILVPFLHGRVNIPQALALSILMWFSHLLSFGHNSLLDACIIPEKDKPPPDFTDSSKSHHPLITGEVNLHTAKNFIFWGLGCLSTAFFIFTFLVAENPVLALASLFFYWVWGVLYNEGLSKESPLGFLSISICFTAMGSLGWFLSHKTLSILGLTYILYAFFTILFQISWSGHLKELGIKERSNILVKMGARIDGDRFIPGKSLIYGVSIKAFNLFLGLRLLLLRFNPISLVWYAFIAAIALFYLYKLTKPRIYNRGKELLSMSLEEIATIYLPVPLMLGWLEASTLMIVGVLYFFLINLALWKKPYPRV